MVGAGRRKDCRWRRLVWLQLAVLLGAPGGLGETWSQEVPGSQAVPVLSRIAPTERGAALGTLRVGPDLEVQLAAAEPEVCDPVALDFDEFGRAYVVEMRGYSEAGAAGLGRVRRLTDRDGDGLYESSDVLVDGLSNPTAIACAYGGVIVGDAPDLLFFADRNGDGVNDERHVLFTGFGTRNIQQLLNNLVWGLDGRLYGASGGNGGDVRRGEGAWPFLTGSAVLAGQPPVDLRGRDFVIDVQRGTLEATTGGGQFGQTIDSWGNRYVCSNSDHCQQIVIEDRYLGRNPLLRSGASRVSIAAEGPAATIYRVSPVEGWRLARTELRIQGKAQGPIEGGGRASGYFSGATGICFYDGIALPEEYRGNLFVADAGSNLVHRKQLMDERVVKSARRVEAEREFLAATDNWFRPVQLLNAPDGALWVLDMYREVVEHPASLPEPIKRQLDLSSGNERGRLYRIVGRGMGGLSGPLPGNAGSLEELVAFLGHPNGWHRRTAARLLRERRGEAAMTAVRKWVDTQPLGKGRIRGWYLLRDWGALSSADLLAALRAEEPEVRIQGLLLAEGNHDPQLQLERSRLAADQDERVRFQAALALGEFPNRGAIEAWARIARDAGSNQWLRLAVLCAAGSQRGELFAELLNESRGELSPAELECVAELARQIGQSENPEDGVRLAAVLDPLIESRPGVAAACWYAATAADPARVEQFDRWGRELAEAGSQPGMSERLVGRARQMALEVDLPVAQRAAAVRLLETLPIEQLMPLWRELIDLSQPETVRLAAIELSGRVARPELVGSLLERLSELTPELRARSIESLLARTDSAALLLTALEAGSVPLVFLSAAQRQQLLNSADVDLRRKAETLLGAGANANTAAQLAAFRETLVGLNGDPAAGRSVFRRVCASCHRLDGEGSEVGPNLVSYAFRSRDDLLLQVFEPNREVDPRYLAYSIELIDGRLLLGVLAGENASAVVIRLATGESVALNRSEIAAIRSTSKSLMPENLMTELNPQQMADLSAWLQSLRE